MSENRTVRVFVSSPSDVRPERLIAERVVNRLAREFSYHFPIEAVLWEREPLLATHHFQDLIVPPHEPNIGQHSTDLGRRHGEGDSGAVCAQQRSGACRDSGRPDVTAAVCHVRGKLVIAAG